MTKLITPMILGTLYFIFQAITAQYAKFTIYNKEKHLEIAITGIAHILFMIMICVMCWIYIHPLPAIIIAIPEIFSTMRKDIKTISIMMWRLECIIVLAGLGLALYMLFTK